MATRQRSRPLLAAVSAILVALPTAASAQSFTPGDDPCLGDPPPAPYVDRDEARDPHLRAIDCTFDNGVMVGEFTVPGAATGERRFHPGQPVTRAQMATIVVNALEYAGYTLPEAPPDAFTDDTGNVHEDNINKLAATGIVSGKSESEYAPNAKIRRDEMATVLVQAAEMAYGSDLEPASGNPFSDVSSSNVHRDNIIVASEILGIAVGQEDGTFQPGAATRRDWMATFASRLVDMTLIDAEEPASDPATGPTVGISDDERSIG